MRPLFVLGMMCMIAGFGCATVEFDERSTGGSDPPTSLETETPGSGTTQEDTVTDSGTSSSSQTDSETSTACMPACGSGNYCDQGDCQPCLVIDHCGPGCDTCGGDTPECVVQTLGVPASAFCGCLATNECDPGRWCDTSAGHGTCTPCGSGTANNAHCGDACTNCAVAGNSCDAEGKCTCLSPEDCNDGSTCINLSCTVCDQDEFCGLGCNDCTKDTDTPYCQGTMCVACTTNDHCLSPAFCQQSTGTCVNCQGTTVGGHCWYLGDLNESCGEVCASHGGYNAGTLTYAGSDGTSEQCQEVLDALRTATTSMLATPPFTEAVGCGYWPGASMGLRVTASATTDTDKNSLVQRACACNN